MKRFHESICKAPLNGRLVARGFTRSSGDQQQLAPRTRSWSTSSHSVEHDLKFKLDDVAVSRSRTIKEKQRTAAVAVIQSTMLPGIRRQKLEPCAWPKERRYSLQRRTSYHRPVHCSADAGVDSGAGTEAEGNGRARASTPDGTTRPDAIMILAGGQTALGGVPIWVERRLEAALAVYHAYDGKVPIVCMGAGTPHRRPILTDTGHVLHEGTSLAKYLLERGVPPSHLVKEWGSYDTVANAFFALVWHALPRRWANLTVVTSDFHMPRSRLLFEWVFGLEGAALPREMLPAGGTTDALSRSPESNGFSLHFVTASDAGIDPSIIMPRRAKEAKSLENVRKNMKRIRSLPEFHAWFHTEHKAYNVADQEDFGRELVKDPALASY